jgi:hypothetical protein
VNGKSGVICSVCKEALSSGVKTIFYSTKATSSNEEIFELMKLTLINNDDSDFKFFTCLLMDRITQNKIKL